MFVEAVCELSTQQERSDQSHGTDAVEDQEVVVEAEAAAAAGGVLVVIGAGPSMLTTNVTNVGNMAIMPMTVPKTNAVVVVAEAEEEGMFNENAWIILL